jgi:hypothetical protein
VSFFSLVFVTYVLIIIIIIIIIIIELPFSALLTLQVVVMVDSTLETLVDINGYCHAHGIKFIAADVCG